VSENNGYAWIVKMSIEYNVVAVFFIKFKSKSMWKFFIQQIRNRMEQQIRGYEAKLSITNEYIIALAIEYNGHLTAERLHRRSGMTESQAYIRLAQLEAKGVFLPTRKKFGYVTMFALSEEYWHEALILQSNSPLILTDADVIEAGMDYGGRLSAAQLCLRMRLPLDTAQAKLDELASKGVFTTHLDEEGVVGYELRDRLLRS
jgi:hypothetical protein